MVEPHRRNNSSVFHIARSDGWRSVEVTETFLDADDGLDGALSRLTGLGVQLTRLRPGQALLVTNDGLRVELAA
jgi:hypothetical protein